MDQGLLDKIRNFANEAHGEQTRKYTGEPYIVHPERVMLTCKEYTKKVPVLAAALLHDVLEDTETSKEDIFSFLKENMSYSAAENTVKLVEELTDVYEKKNYPHWIRDKRKQMESDRLSKASAEAQTIKYADILDNGSEIIHHDPGFSRRYLKECKVLLQKMAKGHTKLRYRAIKVVDENLQKIR